MSDDSTACPPPRKPRPKSKPPRKDFPLRVHKGMGYWCKKIRGRIYYFGTVANDPNGQAALEEYLRVKDDRIAGREPRPKEGDLTVARLCDEFYDHKKTLRENGELASRTLRGYFDTCTGVTETLGLGRTVIDLQPKDFAKLRAKLAETRGPVALRNEMQRVRSIFKFAFDQRLVDAPIRFGQSFTRPKLEVVRKARNAHREEYGERMFEAAELRLLLDALAGKEVIIGTDEKTGEPVKLTWKHNPSLSAMVLLAANCAFGQSDLANLPVSVVNLESGWVNFARKKTGVQRHIPLWCETIAAIREWIPLRPKAKDKADAGLLFLTCRGARWLKVNDKGAPKDAILQEFGKVVRALGLQRPRRGFYSMRHGFETIGGETADQVAVDAIMGHVPQGMAGVYRERIGDDRLRRVVEHVRAWLFADSAPDGGTTGHEPNGGTIPISVAPQQAAGSGSGPVLRLFAG